MALEPLPSLTPDTGDPALPTLHHVNSSLSILLELVQVQFVSPATERLLTDFTNEKSSGGKVLPQVHI